MLHLDLEDALYVAERALGHAPEVRDEGGRAAALPRPPPPLVDGNERLALAATIALLGLNGVRLALTEDEAYSLVMAVATGELDDVGTIAGALRSGSRGAS